MSLLDYLREQRAGPGDAKGSFRKASARLPDGCVLHPDRPANPESGCCTSCEQRAFGRASA